MHKLKLPIMAALAMLACALMPFAASARASHATPKAVAWQMKTLANKNFKFAGDSFRLISVTCVSRGYPLFVCKGTFDDGDRMYWPNVTYKDDGSLHASGGILQ
jgi:hypothetical protein